MTRQAAPVLRVARPTDDIDALVTFYRDGLGFDLLGRFRDHDGFDGVMLGHPRAPWHLEFTRETGRPAGGAPSPEHLLVLYLPDRAAWQAAVGRMRAAGHDPVAAHNPYWDRNGVTFADPDGYRVVLQQADWTL
ncbi:VOC family protein [Maliponia aquimaris]|uniref:Glyoxalase-like domain protein n=1 Tax=Maliponia aquimaris TaxID=1673631 RepID=A0A238KNG1_9RHOB|nr:VOC family protein [Maliponia aquimaris]SMX43556.1 Glyoxalase-like domain protein [Maliponia aquimaris]